MTIRELSRTYAVRDNRRAIFSLVPTLILFFLALGLAAGFRDVPWILIPGVILTAISGVRLYMLQHDCGHGSFFTTRKLNDRVGLLLSPLTLTPYRAGRMNHNLHHAHIGNLDERGASEIFTMTLAEYEAAPLWRKLTYRLYRSPFTLFLFGPTLLYLFRYRWPRNARQAGVMDIVAHNALLAVFLGGLVMLFGWQAVLVWGASLILAASFGALIPYVQHNFEEVYWAEPDVRDFETAALEGSAVIDFGPLFDLATANIAYHDMHHLNASIPSYRLKECHRALEERLDPVKVSPRDALRCFRWKLWDEESRRMIGFPPLLGRTRPVATV
ncbi:omega-6 fatty acid desaturase (delta-12 desaturase) [Poseidonocella pacifica]|uniref:Omega-6 fatty acid desaturase (Delta-12 desaturase) n=1 Tax=Poseidonocella pacifica TaxID=871651 RepID=A0A1I0YQY0_9RHOB|nr:fatty acid desaturase [Poseidonocella pacifica]SFB15724.1 omega-6 fatty acid desaturase (delta-12 desaturase) [Poseidonocella pacifica]